MVAADPRVVRTQRVGEQVRIEVPPSSEPIVIMATLLEVGPGQRVRYAFDVPDGADVGMPQRVRDGR